MIADARTFHERRRKSSILGSDGQPLPREVRRTAPQFDLDALVHPPREQRFAARYDSAQDTDSYRRYWANADTLSADNANSPGIRQKLVSRSRYEAESNPYYAGVLDTHTHYLVGTGPKLRMQTKNAGFNETIEALWNAWWAETGMAAKLWAMTHAKTQDGETFALLISNPNNATKIQLDVWPIETEQCSTPGLFGGEKNYIDGIKFDQFGNPLWYDILEDHPDAGYGALRANQVPASQVLHWFRQRRPGQHRGVPEMTSSLNCGASFRRWRDSTLKAADRAANFSIVLSTDMAPDDADLVTPFSTAEVTPDMMVALPYQYQMNQLEAKHPNANFETFHQTQISEQARPLGMPRNIAGCDSSSYNYASGRLDHQTYFMSLDVEREDCANKLLNKLFRAWWAEAVLVYEFAVESLPSHTWDFPQHPTADIRAEAIANNFNLRNGSIGLAQVYADKGYDAEEQMQAEADLFGVDIAQYKQRVFDTLYPPVALPAAADNGFDPELDTPEAARNA
jgi:lambda family phage portal protein